MPDCCKGVVIPFMHRNSNAPWRSTSAMSATNMVTFPVHATKRRLRCTNKSSCRNPKCTNYIQAKYMHKTAIITSQSEEYSSDVSFCFQVQVQRNQAEGKQIPNPIHLITNLAYDLKLHHTRNMYLWAWLDTCADVNIMPVTLYQLVFKDLEMRRIKTCKMQISMYTADTVKIIGSCIFGIVHPDTKKLVPVTFYVANNEGRCITFMQDTSCTLLNPTVIQSRLHSTMS